MQTFIPQNLRNFIKSYPYQPLPYRVYTGTKLEVMFFLYFPWYYPHGKCADEFVLAKSEEAISNISIVIMISICYALFQFSMSTKILTWNKMEQICNERWLKRAWRSQLNLFSSIQRCQKCIKTNKLYIN